MHRRDRGVLRRLFRVMWLALMGAAVVKELKTSPEERRWHGDLGGVIPYDLRIPTVERARARLWDPHGPLFGPQVFGVGWSLNFGRAAEMLKEATGRTADL